MLAGEETRFCQRIMALDRSRNDNRIHVACGDESLRSRHSFEIWIQSANMFYAGDVHIAHCFKLALRNASEITDQKRPPIAAPNQTNSNLPFHFCFRLSDCF